MVVVGAGMFLDAQRRREGQTVADWVRSASDAGAPHVPSRKLRVLAAETKNHKFLNVFGLPNCVDISGPPKLVGRRRLSPKNTEHA